MNTLYYNNIAIAPAPQIDIETEIDYSNNNIIGYKYIITLNGKAIDDNINFASSLNRASFIKTTLSANGSVLSIKDNDNNELLQAVGGILTNLEFQKNNNTWSQYIDYTAKIKFNELNILGETFNCNNNVFPSHSFSSNLVDLNQFKLKEFSDKWSFSISDEGYDFTDYMDIKISNTQLAVEYTISASADNYFTDNNEVIAGWQQAKNFVQDRLFEQIQNFRKKNILKLNGAVSCDSSASLSLIYDTGSPALLSSLSSYDICNEIVSCSTSESDGSFSATYNAILKYNDNDPDSFGGSKAIHKFNKNVNHNIEGNKDNITIKVDGTIEGLNSGNFTPDLGFGGFSLPKNGKLFKPNNNFDKFLNAKALKTKIINNDEDLTDDFKKVLDITLQTLVPSGVPICSDKISPISFNLTTNEFLGTINYSVTYDTKRIIADDTQDTVIYKTSIDVEGPNHVYAEFPIPNGDYIIQDLDTFTSKKIKVVVNARRKRKDCCLNNSNNTIHNISIQDIEQEMNSYSIPEEMGSFIRTGKNITFNLMDNTYTMSVDYICTKGCHI